MHFEKWQNYVLGLIQRRKDWARVSLRQKFSGSSGPYNLRKREDTIDFGRPLSFFGFDRDWLYLCIWQRQGWKIRV
jgi:hypothetical protein